MKIRNNFLVIVCSLVFLFGAYSVSGQTTDDPLTKACEQTADLAKRQAIEIESLKAQLLLKDEKIAIKEEQIKNKEEQIVFYKEQVKNNNQMDRNSELALSILRQQVTEDLSRIRDLEKENSNLRSSRNWRTVFGFGAGAAAGYYLGNK